MLETLAHALDYIVPVVLIVGAVLFSALLIPNEVKDTKGRTIEDPREKIYRDYISIM